MQINKCKALKLARALPALSRRKKRKVYLFTLRFLLPAILFLFILSACQSHDSAAYVFDNYIYRLSNSLQVKRETVGIVKLLPSYPSRRNLQKNIPRISINLLEFLRLSECELQRHIGQRNGALGRVMESTQQLIYDVTFLSLAKQCLTQLQPGSTLANTLQTAYEHKLTYFPASAWNATFASKEFNYLFSLGAKPLSLTAVKEQPLQLNNALAKLTRGYRRLLNEEWVEDFLTNIETHYQIIESSKRLGEIRLSLQVATHTLREADSLLLARTKKNPLCQKQQGNSQFTIVNAVFHKYYIGQVQPYIAALHQQSSSVFLEIDELLAIQQAPVNIVSFWGEVYHSNNSEWQGFNRAVKTHTLNWQALLRQCGKLPS
jgi:hypothetical protein